MKAVCYLILISSLVTRLGAQTPDLGGVKVALERYSGPAKVSAMSLDKFKLRVQLSRQGDAQALNVRVELPKSGRNVWPANDVEVRDEAGEAMRVRRSGIEWENLVVPVPDKVSAFIVQAVPPPAPSPRTPSTLSRPVCK